MEQNNQQQVHHQIGLMYLPFTQHPELLDLDGMDELINELDLSEIMDKKLSELEGTSIVDTMDESYVVSSIEETLKSEVDRFNKISAIDNKERFNLWYSKYNRIFIENSIEGAYYKLPIKYEHEKAIEEMVNEIANSFPTGSSIVIIVFKILISQKDVPVFVYHPNK